MKTKRGAQKRFKKTAKDEYKRSKSGKSHILTKKTRKRKRNLRKSTLVSKEDKKKVRRLLAS